MQSNFKDYFYFNRSERKGIVLLITIILLIIGSKELLINVEPTTHFGKSNLDSLLSEIQLQLDENDSLKEPSKISSAKINSLDSIHYYDFNPNAFPVQKWQEFGLTEKQAQVIKRYEAAGGNFRTKKDVKKMFVISDLLYAKLEEHILLPDSMIYENKTAKDNSSAKAKARSQLRVDINLADTTEFKKLYGIGSVLSKRIVDYREKLGGFYAKEQLKKVYGLKEEVLLRLDTQLIVSPVNLRKLNINTATVEELKEHPLIRWKQANAIVKYREQHGLYEEVAALKKLVLITEELFQELSPYLEI